MAFDLISHEAHDLALGKPPLSCLPSSASVSDAIAALKLFPDLSEISVWSCFCSHHHHPSPSSSCRCIGKICMLRLLCYLASDKRLLNLDAALESPLSALLEEDAVPSVRHLDPDSSLLEVLDGMVSGAQNMVLQIIQTTKRSHSLTPVEKLKPNRKQPDVMLKDHNGDDYCWITHEDVLRFLLGHIANFSPLTLMSIEELGIIETDFLKVSVDDEASDALEIMKRACIESSAVAVVDCAGKEDEEERLVGEISCSVLQSCDETAAMALATLSVGEFLSYIEGGWNSSSEFVESMCTRLCKKLDEDEEDKDHLQRMLLDAKVSEKSSSDEEFGSESPKTPHELLSKSHSNGSQLQRGHRHRGGGGDGGLLCCRKTSSFIAVIMQCLVRREHHVWVTMEGGSLAGIVTFAGMLGVLFNHLKVC